MKIKEVERGYYQKIQVSQFEPIEWFASFRAEVGEGEDPNEVSEKLYRMAKAEVERSAGEMLPVCDNCGGIPRFKTKKISGVLCQDCQKELDIKNSK